MPALDCDEGFSPRLYNLGECYVVIDFYRSSSPAQDNPLSEAMIEGGQV
jgi:hypothetical protein